ncbi:vWA domain-containing protein [Gloeothece verrucosa]|uniref:von Willebrand factor type A n=1 Tax=Gloeothece verrucosa (strain PCC 7822) TaxID=497965 RepID=E0U6Q4_GLOV7|nr:vWA domain-containing protein [Gloeothece verrucosa]ADN14813.1 von Willebrand factor type A [Gloeothece verrucosa PCC 7822]
MTKPSADQNPESNNPLQQEVNQDVQISEGDLQCSTAVNNVSNINLRLEIIFISFVFICNLFLSIYFPLTVIILLSIILGIILVIYLRLRWKWRNFRKKILSVSLILLIVFIFLLFLIDNFYKDIDQEEKKYLVYMLDNSGSMGCYEERLKNPTLIDPSTKLCKHSAKTTYKIDEVKNFIKKDLRNRYYNGKRPDFGAIYEIGGATLKTGVCQKRFVNPKKMQAKSLEEFEKDIDRIQANVNGASDLGNAIIDVIKELPNPQKYPDRKPEIILITDGDDNCNKPGNTFRDVIEKLDEGKILKPETQKDYSNLVEYLTHVTIVSTNNSCDSFDFLTQRKAKCIESNYYFIILSIIFPLRHTIISLIILLLIIVIYNGLCLLKKLNKLL